MKYPEIFRLLPFSLDKKGVGSTRKIKVAAAILNKARVPNNRNDYDKKKNVERNKKQNLYKLFVRSKSRFSKLAFSTKNENSSRKKLRSKMRGGGSWNVE